VDERQVRTADQQRQLTWLGITRTARGCRLLGWAVPRLGTRKTVVFPDAASLAATPELRCQLALRPEDHRDRTADNFREQQRVAALLGGIGYRLVPASCTVHQAWIGSGPYPYQWCEVDPQPADTP